MSKVDRSNMVPGDHCHISQSPLKGWVTFPITHLKIKPWPLPLLPASKHKLPRSLPCLWVQLSLNWEENVSSFPSSGFSATSESLSSKEFCWQGGWAVECRMEGLRGSEPSVPESILKPTGRLLSLQHSDSRVWTGRQDLPFIGPSAGRGLLLLAGKKFHLPVASAAAQNLGWSSRRDASGCVSTAKPHAAKGRETFVGSCHGVKKQDSKAGCRGTGRQGTPPYLTSGPTPTHNYLRP